MSGGGSIKSNNIAKYSVYLFASLNIIIRMYAIFCLAYAIPSEPIVFLIVLIVAAILVSWGLYFAIFGLRASNDLSVWEQGKGRFTLIYTSKKGNLKCEKRTRKATYYYADVNIHIPQ